MVINDNLAQNCVQPYIYPSTTYWYNYSTVDYVKVEAMKLALEAKSGKPFKEIAKLAAQIEEYLRA